jgi:hypothetical protein
MKSAEHSARNAMAAWGINAVVMKNPQYFHRLPTNDQQYIIISYLMPSVDRNEKLTE